MLIYHDFWRKQNLDSVLLPEYRPSPRMRTIIALLRPSEFKRQLGDMELQALHESWITITTHTARIPKPTAAMPKRCGLNDFSIQPNSRIKRMNALGCGEKRLVASHVCAIGDILKAPSKNSAYCEHKKYNCQRERRCFQSLGFRASS